jgi:hypothetical protein
MCKIFRETEKVPFGGRSGSNGFTLSLSSNFHPYAISFRVADPDPHHFWKLNPDPHNSEKLDPDLH